MMRGLKKHVRCWLTGIGYEMLDGEIEKEAKLQFGRLPVFMLECVLFDA